jgi:hypothetical protein
VRQQTGVGEAPGSQGQASYVPALQRLGGETTHPCVECAQPVRQEGYGTDFVPMWHWFRVMSIPLCGSDAPQRAAGEGILLQERSHVWESWRVYS